MRKGTLGKLALKSRRPMGPGEKLGAWALAAALILGIWNLAWAAVPLVLFVAFCLAAPFVPQGSFFLPVISRGCAPGHAVALTFDDGPDPRTTPVILQKLAAHGVQATFFMTGVNIRRHPGLVRRIIRAGHTVGNHSYDHDPLLALRSMERIYRQISLNQNLLEQFGIRPRAFRPPGGITSPRLAGPLDRCGMVAVNYSCRARDGGNRRIRHLARRILDRIEGGDIVLLHDSTPPDIRDLSRFFEELEQLLQGLRTRALPVLPLDQHIGRPVMAPISAGPDGSRDPARAQRSGP